MANAEAAEVDVETVLIAEAAVADVVTVVTSEAVVVAVEAVVVSRNPVKTRTDSSWRPARSPNLAVATTAVEVESAAITEEVVETAVIVVTAEVATEPTGIEEAAEVEDLRLPAPKTEVPFKSNSPLPRKGRRRARTNKCE